MPYVSISERPSEVYHYINRKHLDSIIKDGRIRRFGDRETWFCCSLDDTLELMRATVMMEGKPFIKVGGSVGYYPEFKPEEYVILRLTPRWQNGLWVRWMQEVPPGASQELKDAAHTFSMLKIGFRGDLKFYDTPEVIEVATLLQEKEQEQSLVETTNMDMSL